MGWRFHDSNALLDRLSRPNPPREHVFLFGSALTAPLCPGERGVPGVLGVIELIRQYYMRSFGSVALADLDKALSADPSRAYQAAFEHLLGRVSIEEANRIIRRAVLQARKDSAAIDEATLADIEALKELEQDDAGWHLAPAVKAVGELLALKPAGFSLLVLTTNFDPLLEVSLERAGRHSFCSALDTDGRLDQVHGHGCHVVHLHGYWLHSNTLHTGVQLQHERPQLQASLERVLANRAIVVVGYGGWDDVFTKALSAILEDPQRNLEILWAFYPSGVEALSRSAEPLLQQLRPGYERGLVTLFQGIDLHALLPQLQARVQRAKATGRRARVPSSPDLSRSGEGYSPLGAEGADSRSSPALPPAVELSSAGPEAADTEVERPRRRSRLLLAALAGAAALAAAGFLSRSQPDSDAQGAPAEVPAPVSNQAAAEENVRRYWGALNAADYASAWRLLSPSFQESVHHGSYADYETTHRNMRVCTVRLEAMSLLSESSEQIMLAVPMTIASGNACKTRQQTYNISLQRTSSEGPWLIARVTVP